MKNTTTTNTSVPYIDEGLRLYAEGQISEALQDFFEAAGQNPTDPLCHYLSGLALRALGLEDEAKAEWQEVLSLALNEAAIAESVGADALASANHEWARDAAHRLLQLDIACAMRPWDTHAAN